MELASSVLGFVASVLLFMPGWRASQTLRLIHRVTETAQEAVRKNEPFDPGLARVETLQQRPAIWSRLDHLFFKAGFFLLCVSFLLAIVAAL